MIEKYLVQERDIEEVMKAARSGRLKDRRTAAYELASMAASSDDNKFRIVAEGGYVGLCEIAVVFRFSPLTDKLNGRQNTNYMYCAFDIFQKVIFC